MHRPDKAPSRVTAAAHIDFTDPHAASHSIASRLSHVERGSLSLFCRELGLVCQSLVILHCHVRVTPELVRIVVPHQAVVLIVPAHTGLAPDLGAGATAASVATAILPLIYGVFLRLEVTGPELGVSFLRVQRLLLLLLEVLLLVFVVVLLLVRHDNALQLLRIIVVHTNVVDRRLVLLVNVLHMDRVLNRAVSDLGALFCGYLPLRTLGDVLSAEVSPFVLEVGILVELLLRSQIPLLLVHLVVEHARLVPSGGRGPSHFGILILTALVHDPGLY